MAYYDNIIFSTTILNIFELLKQATLAHTPYTATIMHSAQENTTKTT